MDTHYIVQLPTRGGHGVLVGDFILTAAHCLDYSTDGSMVLGDYYIEEIQTHRGVTKVRPVVVEPVSDIAVLAALDDQEFGEEADAFQQFCDSTQGVRLAKTEFALHKPVRVKIHGHDGKWINGAATRFNDHLASICVEAESEVKGGASGGPIVDAGGDLVAMVSHFSVPNGRIKSTGLAPRPFYALPVWVCQKLQQLQASRAKPKSQCGKDKV